MICWRYLLLLMTACTALGIVLGAAFRTEIVSLLWEIAP